MNGKSRLRTRHYSFHRRATVKCSEEENALFLFALLICPFVFDRNQRRNEDEHQRSLTILHRARMQGGNNANKMMSRTGIVHGQIIFTSNPISDMP